MTKYVKFKLIHILSYIYFPGQGQSLSYDLILIDAMAFAYFIGRRIGAAPMFLCPDRCVWLVNNAAAFEGHCKGHRWRLIIGETRSMIQLEAQRTSTSSHSRTHAHTHSLTHSHTHALMHTLTHAITHSRTRVSYSLVVVTQKVLGELILRSHLNFKRTELEVFF